MVEFGGKSIYISMEYTDINRMMRLIKNKINYLKYKFYEISNKIFLILYI